MKGALPESQTIPMELLHVLCLAQLITTVHGTLKPEIRKS